MCKSILADQVISMLLAINNESISSGLYKCRSDLLPFIYLQHFDQPYSDRDGYTYCQLKPLNLNIKSWTPMALAAVISNTLPGRSAQVRTTIGLISAHLDVFVYNHRVYNISNTPLSI